jgi:hypothetical protein
VVEFCIMMRKVLAFVFWGAVTATSAQQNGANHPPCGSQVVHERAGHEWPAYAMGMARMSARSESLEGGSTGCVVGDGLSEAEIPVVFHVMHVGSAYGDSENITDAQIESAIVALNNDFRHISGTLGDGDGVDTGISFVKARRDPQGQPTSGVLRVDGRAVQGYEEDGIALSALDPGASELALKGLSVWPAEEYVNVWVVSEISGNNAGTGIQGFAYLGPTGNVADGIVILYNAIGTVGNVKPSTNLNRTFTHEMGHHLSLYHTFHNTLGCATESNCATQGDKVCDTPSTTSNAACFTPACDGAQPENYMDYAPSWCRNMFTQGQTERMWACLMEERPGLLCSLGGVSPVDHDLGVTWVATSEDGGSCGSTWTPRVRVSNQGLLPAEGWGVSCALDGSPLLPISSMPTLNPGESADVDWVVDTLAPGTHELEATLVWAPDEFAGNDTTVQTINHLPLPQWTVSIYTDFFAPETSWNMMDEAGNTLFSFQPSTTGNQLFEYSFCASPGCYTLHLTDAGGDGMRFGGWYSVVDDVGTVLLEEVESVGDNFGSAVTHELCQTELLVLGGCTYPTALNFDAEAQEDDGSCEFPCFGDSDGDGFVGIGDLLNMLPLIGQACSVSGSE